MIKKGRDFLLKIEDPENASEYITVAAMTATGVALSSQFVTANDLLQHTTEQPTDAGERLQSVNISFQGFSDSSDSLYEIITRWQSGELFSAKINMDNAEEVTQNEFFANAKIQSLSLDGGAAGAQTFSGSLKLYDLTYQQTSLIYLAWNPDDKSDNINLSTDNLTVEASSQRLVRATPIPTTGRFYAEFTPSASGATMYFGLCDLNLAHNSFYWPGRDYGSGRGASIDYQGYVWNNQTVGGTISSSYYFAYTYTTVSIAVDYDNGIITFDTPANSNPITCGFDNAVSQALCVYTDFDGSESGTLNVGQSAFIGTPPANYAAGFYTGETQASINTEAANEATYTILERTERELESALYPDGLECTGLKASVFRSKSKKTSGKYYIEVTLSDFPNSSYFGVGVVADGYPSLYTNLPTRFAGFENAGLRIGANSGDREIEYWLNAGGTTGDTTVTIQTSCRVVSMAADFDGLSVTFRDETNDVDIGTQSLVASDDWYFFVNVFQHSITVNAGQSAFVGSVPSGYTAGWTK